MNNSKRIIFKINKFLLSLARTQTHIIYMYIVRERERTINYTIRI